MPWRRIRRQHRRLAFLLGGLGIALVAVGWSTGSAALVAAALIAVLVGAVWYVRTDPDRVVPRWRWVLPAAVVAIGLAMIAAYLRFSLEGFGLLGAILVYLGVGSLVGKARRSLRARWLPGPLVLAASAVAFVVGVHALSPGLPRWAVVTVALSVLIVPLGVSLLSEVVLHHLAGPSRPARDVEAADPTRTGDPATGPARPSDGEGADEQRPPHQRHRRVLLLAGLALAAAATAVLLAGGLGPATAALVLLVAGLLLWAIVSDNAIDTALVAVGLAVVLALAAGDAPLGPQHQPAAGQATLVAFGDSYASGEGAQTYFDGTNRRDANVCRRAPTAYAALLVGDGDEARFPHLAFLACSAARATDLHRTAQFPDEPPGQARAGDGEPTGLHQLAHLAHLQEQVDFPIELALVSIGGNDAGFSMIGMTCLAPGNCDEVGRFWTDNLPHVRAQVREAFEALGAGLDDQVPVVVVPYPMPLDPDGCDATWLTDAEHAFLARFVTHLNAAIEAEAAMAGFWYLDAMETSLEDASLRLCDGSPRRVGVNFIGLRSVGGTLEQVLTPTNWFRNSLHPNTTGHAAMAATFRGWLDERPDLSPVPDTGPATDPADKPAIAAAGETEPPCSLTETGSTGCDAQARDWAIDRTVELLWREGVVALLGLVGVWVFWLGVVGIWRAHRVGARAVGS
jgi:lysophospholipase L1-like esterase